MKEEEEREEEEKEGEEYLPQGSVLGLKYYTMYIKPLGSISKNHGLVHHFYADDSQLYLSFKPTDIVAHTEALCRVESCLNDIVAWMHDNMLKLNTDKKKLFSLHRIPTQYNKFVKKSIGDCW